MLSGCRNVLAAQMLNLPESFSCPAAEYERLGRILQCAADQHPSACPAPVLQDAAPAVV